MDVPDDVEGAALLLPVVPEGLPLQKGSINFLLRAQHEYVTEALALEFFDRPPELLGLLVDDMRSKVAVYAAFVPIPTDVLAEVEHDRDRQAMILACQRHQGPPRLLLHVGGVHHRQTGGRQTFRRDKAQHFKCVVGRRLVVLVVRYKAAAEVG